MLDTAGVQVRFAKSGATFEGSLVDGPLQSRDGGVLRVGDNLSTSIGWLYLGRHLQRALFADPARLDLRWRDGAVRREGAAAGSDLCSVARGKEAAYGAFYNFGACLRPGLRRDNASGREPGAHGL